MRVRHSKRLFWILCLIAVVPLLAIAQGQESPDFVGLMGEAERRRCGFHRLTPDERSATNELLRDVAERFARARYPQGWRPQMISSRGEGGRLVVLTDGSVWAVARSDRARALALSSPVVVSDEERPGVHELRSVRPTEDGGAEITGRARARFLGMLD